MVVGTTFVDDQKAMYTSKLGNSARRMQFTHNLVHMITEIEGLDSTSSFDEKFLESLIYNLHHEKYHKLWDKLRKENISHELYGAHGSFLNSSNAKSLHSARVFVAYAKLDAAKTTTKNATTRNVGAHNAWIQNYMQKMAIPIEPLKRLHFVPPPSVNTWQHDSNKNGHIQPHGTQERLAPSVCVLYI